MINIGRVSEASLPSLVMGEVWDYLTDDSGLKFEDYEPRIDDDSRWYVSVADDFEVVGAFWCRRVNLVTWEAHANIRPKFWGDKNGTKHCQAAIDLMFEDTGGLKMIALIADCFPHVQQMAEAIGFEREGVQTLSWKRDGKLYDQIHYGINRP